MGAEVRNEHGQRGNGSEDALRSLKAAQRTDEAARLVVFDFDRTIMRDHLWAKFRNTPIQDIQITDNMFVSLPRFQALVRSLQLNGHSVAVATFGRREVVEKALRHALGEHDICIRTPADFGHRDGSAALGDKNTQLAALASRFGVAADQIILLDDDEKNIEAAERAGINAQWVPDGLTKPVVKRIARDLGTSTYRTMSQVYGGQIPERQRQSVGHVRPSSVGRPSALKGRIRPPVANSSLVRMGGEHPTASRGASPGSGRGTPRAQTPHRARANMHRVGTQSILYSGHTTPPRHPWNHGRGMPQVGYNMGSTALWAGAGRGLR